MAQLPAGFELQPPPAGPSNLPPGFEVQKSYGFTDSLKAQAKGLFDTLTAIIDPHLGQKIGDAAIDAQVDQWHKAKEEYKSGNYGNAIRRGLAAATPFIGPMIENSAEKLATPGQRLGGLTDIAALPVAMEIGSRLPAAAGLVRAGVTAAVDATSSAMESAANRVSSTVKANPAAIAVAQDVGKMVFPTMTKRAEGAVSLVNRLKRVADNFQKMRQGPAPEAPPAAGMNTNEPAALQAAAGPAPRPPTEAPVSTSLPAGFTLAESGTSGLEASVTPALYDDIAVSFPGGKKYNLRPPHEQQTVRNIAESIQRRAAPAAPADQPPSVIPPASVVEQTAVAPLDKITSPAESTPIAAATPVEQIDTPPNVSRETPPPPGIAPFEPAASMPEEGETPPASARTPLPGHTALDSRAAYSAGFNPETGVPQIHFHGPGGTAGKLYEYREMPPELLRSALADAPSFGKFLHTHVLKKFQPTLVETPTPDKPLLSGVEYGKIPTDEAQANAGTGTPGPREPLPQPTSAKPQTGRGKTTSVIVPGEDAGYPGQYRIVELSDLQTSHNGNTFQPNPKYTLKNDRDYTQIENQGKVLNAALPAKWKPELLINDNPDSANGPPIVDRQGNALGGNGRGMMLQRVYKSNLKGAEAYKAILKEKAGQFGIDPAHIDQFKEPVLIREVDELGERSAANAITDLNKTGTAALKPAERAIADSRRVSPETLAHIGKRFDELGSAATLAQVLKGQDGLDVLSKLTQDGVITQQEHAGLATKDALTKEGQARISKLLLGRFFKDPAQLDTMAPTVRAKLERVAAPLAAAESVKGWSVTENLQKALDLIEEARASGKKNIDAFLKWRTEEPTLIPKEDFPAETVGFAKSLQRVTSEQLKNATEGYLEKARYAKNYQGPGLFGEFPHPLKPAMAWKALLEDLKRPKIPKPAKPAQP